MANNQGSFRDKDTMAGQASKAANDLKNKAQDVAASAAQKAQQAGTQVAQKAQDAASSVGQKAQDFASNVGQKAREMGSSAVDQTDDALASVGERMTSLAGTIRESAPEGRLGTAATVVADQLQAGGAYLKEHDLQQMSEDVAAIVRKHPLPSVFVGFGIGCLVGIAMLPSRR